MFKKILSGVLAAMLVAGTMMCTGCSDNNTFVADRKAYNKYESKITVNGDKKSGTAAVEYMPYGIGSMSGFISSRDCVYSVSGTTVKLTINNVSEGDAIITGTINSNFTVINHTDGQGNKWIYTR